MPLLAVLAGIWALALVYVGWIHVRAAGERAARRSGHAARIAVRVWRPAASPAGTLHDDAREGARWLTGALNDRPLVVPLIAAIIASGGAAFLLVDPLMDEPLLWAGPKSGVSLHGLPQIVRIALAAIILVAAIVHIVWVFFAAPLTLSWEKLALEPDGRIGLGDGATPEIDPRRASLVSLSIPSAHGAPAMGVTLEQGGLHYAFDYFGKPRGNMLAPTPAVPHDWWHIVLAGEIDRVDAFLRRHYGPGSAPFARITPMPDDDS